MRIWISVNVWRASETARKRELRRMVYVAWLLRDLGHEVVLDTRLGREWSLHDFGSIIGDMPGSDECPSDTDLYICSAGQVANLRHTLPPVPVVAWKETIDFLDDRHLAGLHGVVGAVCFHEEWSVAPPALYRGEPDRLRPIAMQVPFPPHERVLAQFWEDGLTEAYLRDNLQEIRDRYRPADERYKIGFYGFATGARTVIVEHLLWMLPVGTFDVRWTDIGRGDVLPPAEYLTWTAGKQAILNLPGECYKCYRFAEAVMMGTPVIQSTMYPFDITPPLSADNCIQVGDWADDLEAMLGGAAFGEDIALAADRCYREGWSLRGQVMQLIRRYGNE